MELVISTGLSGQLFAQHLSETNTAVRLLNRGPILEGEVWFFDEGLGPIRGLSLEYFLNPVVVHEGLHLRFQELSAYEERAAGPLARAVVSVFDTVLDGGGECLDRVEIFGFEVKGGRLVGVNTEFGFEPCRRVFVDAPLHLIAQWAGLDLSPSPSVVEVTSEQGEPPLQNTTIWGAFNGRSFGRRHEVECVELGQCLTPIPAEVAQVKVEQMLEKLVKMGVYPVGCNAMVCAAGVQSVIVAARLLREGGSVLALRSALTSHVPALPRVVVGVQHASE